MKNEAPANNKDKYFKGQQKNEVLICFFRHHWIDLLREFVYFGLFITIVVSLITHATAVQEVMRGNRELKLFFFTGYLMLTIYMHRFILIIMNYIVNIGIITNIRVIDHQKTLFFKDTLDSIDLAQIQNIEKVEDGILPSLLGYGDIKIYLTASDATKTFTRVPNAKYHFRCLNRLRETRQAALYRRQRAPQQFRDQMIKAAPASEQETKLDSTEDDQFSQPIQIIRSTPNQNTETKR